MRKIFLLLFITIISFQNLSAQVKGIVIDSASKSPIDRAVIGLVVKSKITDTSYIITNEKGEFSFSSVPSFNFSVIITTMGYRPVAKFIPVNSAEKTIDLGNITLVSMAKVLNEVVIEASPITIKEDTIEYRADAFKVKENAVVEDLIKKMPGIQVDKNGNIKAQGKAVTKVKVNGKDFFGGDPKTATKELPANIVDKIQIIDDYGDQATISGIKDGDPQKVMNIQLKKDKNTGYFGRATVGVGTKDRYQASFNGNYFNNNQQISLFSNSNNTSQSLFSFGGGGGMGTTINNAQKTISDMGGAGVVMNAVSNGDMSLLQNGNGGSDGITTTNSVGINYRDQWGKKVSIYGSYSYSHRNNSGYKLISQQNIFPSGTFTNDQDNNFYNIGDNHRFFFNLEYNIDSLNYIKISPNISYANSNGNSNSMFDYFNQNNIKTSEGNNNNITKHTNPNIGGTVLYNHKFNRRGRNFSLNFTAGKSENKTDQDSKNNTVQYVPFVNNYARFLYSMQQNDNYNYNIRLTYTEPLSKVRFLDVAFSHNFSYSRNDKRTYNIDPVTKAQLFSSQLSNDYENNYITDRANVTLRTIQKKYNYTFGISIQPVDLNGFSITKDSAYKPIRKVNIFPVARLSFNFSKTKSLSINYRGDAQQPGFSQLQEVIDSSNSQYITRGNPNLKPSLNHSINLFYNNFNFVSGRVLFTSIAFSTIQNQIVNNVISLGTSGAQLTIPENVSGYYNASGFYTFSHPYKNRKFIITLNGTLNYNHNINLINNLKNIGKNWVASQGLTFELNHKDWLEFGAGATYNVNSVKYANAASSLTTLPNEQYSSWVITSTTNINIPKNWVVRYDFEYSINKGLSGPVSKNPVIMNASVEKQLFKKKNGIIRLQAYDLFNQNSNITRSISANSIIDTRTSKLTRYFMLSFTYRLQKFFGKQPQPKNFNALPIRIGH
ncbi:MAG: outer membrane beta-barrel protein [Bacteroidota bacterium]|nr:outer membrane beta-barrel protein [Bacteroidota bacterium]